MAGIASAVVRTRNAWGATTINVLIDKIKSYSHAVSEENERYKKLICSNSEASYHLAYEAARNALNGGKDYANGGCFWDGLDLKIDAKKHYRYQRGYRFTTLAHNLFALQEPPPYQYRGALGSYSYTYESTAAYGETTFWKYSKEYMNATGTKQCR